MTVIGLFPGIFLYDVVHGVKERHIRVGMKTIFPREYSWLQEWPRHPWHLQWDEVDALTADHSFFVRIFIAFDDVADAALFTLFFSGPDEVLE